MSEGKYQREEMRIEQVFVNAFLAKAFNEGKWVKPDLSTVSIKDMDTSYINSCIKMIEEGIVPNRQPWHELLSAELVKRQGKVLDSDAELIHEMKSEIADLKSKVNRLEQKLASKQTVIDVFNGL